MQQEGRLRCPQGKSFYICLVSNQWLRQHQLSGVSAEIPMFLIYEAVGGEESLIKGFPGDSRSPAAQMSYSLPPGLSPHGHLDSFYLL